MEKVDRDKIQMHIKTLSTMVNMEELASILITKGVIDRTFYERIKSKYVFTEERNQEFFLRYMKRGPTAFRDLIDSLKQTGHISEAQQLECSPFQHRIQDSLSPVESPSEHSTSSNGSFGNNHSFTFESPVSSGSSPSTSSSNSVAGSSEAGNLNKTSMRFAERVEPLSPPESPPAQGLNQLSLDLQPLILNIKQAQTYNEGKFNPNDAYPMMSKPRGFALIVNNLEFKGDPEATRTGAEVDSDCLGKLMEGFGFILTVRHNVTKDELLNSKTGILKRFIDQFSTTNVDCCIVSFMSHGQGDYIRMCDPDRGFMESNHVHVYNEIIQRFNNLQCPVLMDKPKIFIMQACRGDIKDRGVRRTQTDGKSLNMMTSASQNFNTPAYYYDSSEPSPTNEDILVCFPTVPGYVANRDTVLGTWYIRCLCEIFAENAHKMEIMYLLKEVGKRMKIMKSERGEKQMSSFKNIGFNKELYFNPGLYADNSSDQPTDSTNGIGATDASPLP